MSRKSDFPPSDADQPDPGLLSDEERAARRAQVEQQSAQQDRRLGIELLSQGARLLAQGRPGEAVTKLEQARKLLPDDLDAVINLGGAYVMQGRYNKAVTVLERATEIDPTNPMLWTNLAAAYLGNLDLSGPQQQERAIEAYERALALDPSAPNVHYNLGLIYKDRRDWMRAKSYFLLAAQVDPNDRDARSWLARLSTLSGDEGSST